MGSVLNAFHPDATASARGLKTWLFSVFRPVLAHWAVFYRLSIRTCGRPQTLPGGIRLPLALLGASKLGFSPFGQALAHWAVF